MHPFHISLWHLLIGVGCISPLVFLQPQSDAKQLFLGKYPSPEESNGPININSKNVTDVTTLTPFSLHATLSDRVKVVNTGKSVEIFLTQRKTTSSVTGGVLKKDRYIFKKIKYIWTDNTTGIAGPTIDNKGYPLENVAIFYNEKYRTFRNALKYPDGLAEVDFSIGICSEPNELFDKYSEKLRKIRKAGSSARTTLGTSIIWFAGNGIIPPNSAYYAYPTAYIDERTGHKYYCSTAIMLPHLSQWCLSEKQYGGTIGSFENPMGRPLTNVEGRFPQNMPVVRARGIVNSNTP